jgi:hypothetical protein
MSNNLAASNRSQLGYKLEGVYPVNFGVPQGGNGTNLNMLSETFDYTIKNESSKTIRSDRQTPDIVQVGASSAGGFAFEAQYREYDPFIQGVMQSDYTVFGTNGVGAPLASLAFTATTITASAATSGVSLWTTLNKGQWLALIPPNAASPAVKEYFAGRAFRLSATVAATPTVLTLDPVTPIDVTKAGNAMAAGALVGTSYAYNGQLMKSYTFEVGHGDIGQYRQYQGMVPSKMDIKLSVGSIVTGSFDFMGKSFELLDASAQGAPNESQVFTPANATRGVFDIFEDGASISASTYIKSGEFSVSNTLRMQDAVGVFGTAGIGVGSFKATGKLEVYFANAVIYRKLLSGVATSLTIPLLDVNGNGYIYHFPSIKYTAAKVAVGGLDQDNMLQMDWEAKLDGNPASPTYLKTVAIYRVGAAGPVVPGAVDTRPRFGLGAANAYLTPGALLAAMTPLTGSANNGHAGTMSLTTTSGQYGWLAVEATNSAAGIHVFDGVGMGGWSGAGLPGNYTGATEDPSVSTVTYTDGNGTTWRLFRQDYVNANPTAAGYTVS